MVHINQHTRLLYNMHCAINARGKMLENGLRISFKMSVALTANWPPVSFQSSFHAMPLHMRVINLVTDDLLKKWRLGDDNPPSLMKLYGERKLNRLQWGTLYQYYREQTGDYWNNSQTAKLKSHV